MDAGGNLFVHFISLVYRGFVFILTSNLVVLLVLCSDFVYKIV